MNYDVQVFKAGLARHAQRICAALRMRSFLDMEHLH